MRSIHGVDFVWAQLPWGHCMGSPVEVPLHGVRSRRGIAWGSSIGWAAVPSSIGRCSSRFMGRGAMGCLSRAIAMGRCRSGFMGSGSGVHLMGSVARGSHGSASGVSVGERRRCPDRSEERESSSDEAEYGDTPDRVDAEPEPYRTTCKQSEYDHHPDVRCIHLPCPVPLERCTGGLNMKLELVVEAFPKLWRQGIPELCEGPGTSGNRSCRGIAEEDAARSDDDRE